MNLRRHKHEHLARLTVVLVSICAVATVLLVVAQRFVTYNNGASDDPNRVITYSTDKPSEVPPDDKFVWKGGPNDPKQVVIDSIGAKPYVQKVGIDQNKQVAVPNNTHLVGWFVDSVRPGEKGLSLIDGHVTGRKDKGVFKDLDILNRGDNFSVILGNGKELKYRVVDMKSAKVNESVGIMFSQNPKIANQLNLVTCSGRYDPKSKTYDERLTVMAEQITSQP